MSGTTAQRQASAATKRKRDLQGKFKPCEIAVRASDNIDAPYETQLEEPFAPDYASLTDGRIVGVSSDKHKPGPGIGYFQEGRGPRSGKRVNRIPLTDRGEHDWDFTADDRCESSTVSV